MRLKTLLPAGACKGTTKSGGKCQSKDTFENGFCRHHNGQGKSLTARRLDLAIELAKIRANGRGRKARYNAAKLRILEAKKAIQEKENAPITNQT
jgi:hypothetical protein